MSGVFEIGPFRLDPVARILTLDGMPAALGARAVAVLAALVEKTDEYVSNAEIFDAAWPGRVIEKGNLAVQISAIRKVLAQAPGGERWVETLGRHGYRFVGPVKPPQQAARDDLRGAVRAALEAAEEHASAYRDDLDFVDLAPLANLADLAWTLGDLEASARAMRRNVALTRHLPGGLPTLGIALANLAGVLIEMGELDQAREHVRESLALLRDNHCAWLAMDHFALRAALVGRMADAARLLGYTDAALAARNGRRHPNEARAAGQLERLLARELAPAVFAALRKEGATLSEESACRVAAE